MDHPNFLQEGQALPQRKNPAYYGQRHLVIAQHPSEGSRPTECDYISAINKNPGSVHDTQISPNAAVMRPEEDYVCIKEHQCVMNENERLLQELQLARRDTDKATKACRELATWAYHERSRLIRELEEANLSGTQGLEQAIGKEKSVLAQAVMSFLVQEVNNARNEIGLPLLSQEEMRLRFELKDMEPMALNKRQPSGMCGKKGDDGISVRDQGADQSDEHYFHDVEGTSSIVEQVDALIAEEKVRLAILD